MFTPATFTFLRELSAHNNREWFEANRERYESQVRTPALDFIEAIAPHLQSFAPRFVAEPKKVGGSLMRIHRDTRFARDKTPYKTNIGIQLRHENARDVHAPGFYLHISNDECFLGVGCWHPEAEALLQIRQHIAAKPRAWLAARDDSAFRSRFELTGESVSRPPRGFAATHRCIADIQRKDFIGLAPLTREQILDKDLARHAAKAFAAAAPFMRFLCVALGAKY